MCTLCANGKLSTLLMILTALARAQPPTTVTLHTFAGAPNDGGNPSAGVVIGKSGILYGTTYTGGTGDPFYDPGTVFSLTPPASPGGSWSETLLHSFTGIDGASPTAGLAIADDGVIYGTTYRGGSSQSGTVFSLTPPQSGDGAWTEAVLYSFTGGDDGAEPQAALAIGKDHVLYGTTRSGGISQVYGTVFSLTPPATPGGAWTETVLYNFAGGSDGANPSAGVAIGRDGVLYGTTTFGGTAAACKRSGGCGTVFSLTPPISPGGAWSELLLHTFSSIDGAGPRGGVAIGEGGVLYGTTENGGSTQVDGTGGLGTVYALTPPAFPGAPWTEAVLYSFTDDTGSFPYAGLAIGRAGVLYGTTYSGGAAGLGAVFSVTPPASPDGAWTGALLYSLTESAGAHPYAALAIGSSGVLYGTANSGGSYSEYCAVGCGTVFSLSR
jgi:uncharacterized repeat protein (TIGR03803 family)